MPIASTGPVTFTNLRTEFIGGSAAINFSDLYRGGSNSYIRAKAGNNTAVNLAPNVPTSGAISVGNFRGASKGFRFTFTSNATNQDASAIFGDDYGVDYPKEIVIDSGVELGGTSASQEALQIDSGGVGTITITNNGTLAGAGGAAGGDGGDAFEANVTCIFINNGSIRSGGGGGATGGAGGAGGGGQTSSTGGYTLYLTASGGACNYTCPSSYGGYSYINRVANCTIMMDAATTKCYGNRVTVTNTDGGAAGAAGAGGVGAGYSQSATDGSSGGSGGSGGTSAGTGGNGGNGGNGGAFGVDGTTGTDGTAGSNGNRTNGAAGGSATSAGSAGKSIRGISSVTLTNNGTITGPQA